MIWTDAASLVSRRCNMSAAGLGQYPDIVQQIEADILTISWDNSILVLSCSFKASKYISECWPRWNFLWALANTFFYDVTIKLYYCQKRWYFKFNFRKNNLHQQKARKKLNIRHLNGHLDFSSGFQVIDRSNYEKNAKIAQKTWALV